MRSGIQCAYYTYCVYRYVRSVLIAVNGHNDNSYEHLLYASVLCATRSAHILIKYIH